MAGIPVVPRPALESLGLGGLEALEPQIYDCFHVSTIFSRHIPVNL